MPSLLKACALAATKAVTQALRRPESLTDRELAAHVVAQAAFDAADDFGFDLDAHLILVRCAAAAMAAARHLDGVGVDEVAGIAVDCAKRFCGPEEQAVAESWVVEKHVTSSPGQRGLFDEDEHPRADDGKFAHKDGGGEHHTARESPKAETPAEKHHDKPESAKESDEEPASPLADAAKRLDQQYLQRLDEDGAKIEDVTHVTKHDLAELNRAADDLEKEYGKEFVGDRTVRTGSTGNLTFGDNGLRRVDGVLGLLTQSDQFIVADSRVEKRHGGKWVQVSDDAPESKPEKQDTPNPEPKAADKPKEEPKPESAKPDGKTNEDLHAAWKAGDKEAGNQLVSGNIGLVNSVVAKYAKNPEQMDSLRTAGMYGIFKAMQSYDPERGMAFSGWAFKYIKSNISREAASTKRRQGIGNVDRDDEDRRELEAVDEVGLSPDRDAQRHDTLEKLEKHLDRLDDDEREMVEATHGLGGRPVEKQKDIAKRLGLPNKMAATRLLRRALSKLESGMKPSELDYLAESLINDVCEMRVFEHAAPGQAEPWQKPLSQVHQEMEREHKAKNLGPLARTKDRYARTAAHEKSVEDAIHAGKQVPAEVLKDYQHLLPKSKQAPAQPAAQQPQAATQQSAAPAAKSESSSGSGSRWITIGGTKGENGEEHKGGFPIEIDGQGRILKSGGPRGLVGKTVDSVHKFFHKKNQARKQSAGAVQRRHAKQAAGWGMDPKQYEQIADEVWKQRADQINHRNAARTHLSRRLGLHRSDIHRMENQNKDHASVPGIDTAGVDLASSYPGLGWTVPDFYDTGDFRGKTDYSQLAWDLLKEDKEVVPPKNSDEYHAAVDEYLQHLADSSGGFGGGDEQPQHQQQVAQDDGLDSFGEPIHPQHHQHTGHHKHQDDDISFDFASYCQQNGIGRKVMEAVTFDTDAAGNRLISVCGANGFQIQVGRSGIIESCGRFEKLVGQHVSEVGANFDRVRANWSRRTLTDVPSGAYESLLLAMEAVAFAAKHSV